MEPLHEELGRAFPVLLGGADEFVSRMLTAVRRVSLHAGDRVFHAGDSCDNYLLVVDGNIRVQLTAANGREVTLYRIGSGGSCVLTTSCLLASDQYPAEALAESDVVAIAVPRSRFQETLQRSEEFRQFVFDGFASRLSTVIERIEEIAFTSIDQRLAAALIRLDDQGKEHATHQDLAVEIGTAREVVSRHLKRFERYGWVALGRGRVTVSDRARLEAIAKCD